MADNALLEVRGVSKRFGGLRALNDVNLTVAEGSIHAIIGPNGAGKSTLLNVLIGLIEADEGTISYAGETLKGLSDEALDRVADLITRVKALHSYSLPCIVSLEVEDGYAPFLEWIAGRVTLG